MAAVKGAPPGPIPRLPLLGPKSSTKNKYKSLHIRVKQRYFEELAAIWSEVGGEESEDENYPGGLPERSLKKKKQSVAGQVNIFLPLIFILIPIEKNPFLFNGGFMDEC